MSKRSGGAAALPPVFALASALALLAGARASDAPRPAAGAGESRPGKDPFGLAKVWRLDLRLSAEEYARLQPSGGFGPPGFPGGPPRGPAGRPADAHRGGFGLELPWARADLSAG